MIDFEDDSEARSTIKQFVDDILAKWLNHGQIPEHGVEAMTPHLRELLNGDASSFEDYKHRDYLRPDWGFSRYHLEQFFDAPWEFYMPTSWRIEAAEDGYSANVIDALEKRRQAIQPTHRDRHPADIQWIFSAGEVIGFEFSSEQSEYLNWRFVMRGAHGYNVFSVFTAGEYGVLVVGFAANGEEVKEQLQCSMTSIPWYHWMNQ